MIMKRKYLKVQETIMNTYTFVEHVVTYNIEKNKGDDLFPSISCKAVSNGKSRECYLHMSLCMLSVRDLKCF